MPVRHRLRLSSHSLFVAEVVVLHALPDVLNGRNEVDFHQACYQAAVVRERPVDNFRPDTPRQKVYGDHQKPGATSGEEKKSRVSLLYPWCKLAVIWTNPTNMAP
jgi:hypothetical protein